MTGHFEDSDDDCLEITPDMLETAPGGKSGHAGCDIESGFSYLNPFFLILAAIFIVVFIIQIQQGLFSPKDGIDMTNFTYRYSNYRAGWNYDGIMTSIFLHGSVEHLLGNVLMFYVLALISYRIIGFLDSVIIFLSTGFFAGITSFYLGSVPAIGASGAIFWLFGFVSVFYIIERKNLSENLEDLSWVMAITGILQILSGFAVPYIDNFAHLGGFISGCVIGYYYFQNHKNKILSKLS